MIKLANGRVRVELLEARALLSAGDIDVSFGQTGVIHFSQDRPATIWTAGAARLPDGKIVLAGEPSSGDLALGRLNPQGTPDASFGADGFISYSYASSRPRHVVVNGFQ